MTKDDAIEHLARLWHSMAVEVWATIPNPHAVPRYALYRDKAEREVHHHYPEFAPPTGEPCATCAKKEGEVNHPHGMIFVGWGTGWQPCPNCGGKGTK